jgi:hypothetical protein
MDAVEDPRRHQAALGTVLIIQDTRNIDDVMLAHDLVCSTLGFEVDGVRIKGFG